VKTELNDSTKELIARYLAEECSAQEKKTLLDWRSESAQNESAFAEFQKTFELAQKHFSAMGGKRPAINVNAEWDVFLKNISKKGEAPIRTMAPTGSFNFWMRVAASFLVLAVTGGLIYSLLSNGEDTLLTTTNSTLRAELPDGSVVVMNRNSELRYDDDFNEKNRTIQLKGEAYFDVKPDAARPFIIHAGKAQVEVVGTSFTVTAYDSSADVEVIVESGKVKLTIPELKKEIQLTPGEKGTYVANSTSVTSAQNEDANYQSWNTLKIVFMDESLRNVIETLNRTYHTNIILAAAVSDSCALTVTFDQQSLESVLKVLESTLNLTIIRNGDQIEITAAGC
jgi:transmembrane sensor